MIPKIIHYCWLSNDPVPETFKRYMSSWKSKLPDYEFMLWNFDRFPKNKSKWVSDAYDCKKYAFAADYIRLYALYNYGGIYLDMDVEVLKSFNDFLELDTMICWQKDSNSGLEVAAFGTKKHSGWVNRCLESYENKFFMDDKGNLNLMPLPLRIENILRENNYQLVGVQDISQAKEYEADKIIPVFSPDFFSPKSYLNGKVTITSFTYSIHHFSGSWMSKWKKHLLTFLRVLKKK